MIVVDTSAWVEFLRGTDSAVCNTVDGLLDAEDLAVTDVISMEVLAGGRDDHHVAQLRGLLARAAQLPTDAASYDHAAALYRRCRRRGETVPKLIDCLIAAVVIDADASLLHADADYDVLARHTPLRVHEVR
ncbi:PIN domain nuclease [Euzebya sp.]|uniref:type II toxin-antitoxin system VapC family toxin n=1 Tax=Euzebya sp. TaxID=1971409 RepID=UPI003514B6A0